MERFQKLELIKRSLGLRHKLKVHESMKAPETHEDLALMLLSKWELEDELKAIDDLIVESRVKNVGYKRTMVEKEYLESPSEPAAPAKKKTKK
jgi:hypothetical protein